MQHAFDQFTVHYSETQHFACVSSRNEKREEKIGMESLYLQEQRRLYILSVVYSAAEIRAAAKSPERTSINTENFNFY